MTIVGRGVSGGIALGPLYFVRRAAISTEPVPVADSGKEAQRFRDAVAETREKLERLAEASAGSLGQENASLFEVHQMILDDPDFFQEIIDRICGESVCAEYAAAQVGAAVERSFAEMEDAYMSARAADIHDVTLRVLESLAGVSQEISLEVPSIVAAGDLAPSEIASLPRDKILAIATCGGAATSHTAIFARTLGVPAVVGLGDALCGELDGHLVLLDGGTGTLEVDPGEELLGAARKQMAELAARKRHFESFRGAKSATRGGRTVKLLANIASPADLEAVKNGDAEGVGLFRSEFLFLGRTAPPDEEEQFAAYRAVAEGLAGKPVIIRTLDIGADKQVAYLDLPQEENPAMGLRGVRLCLERPDLFKTQLRAIYRASAYGNVAVMFPMIASPWEVRRCREICGEVREELAGEGVPFSHRVELGIMVETPAAAVISDLLAPMVDFFSLGTNDLIQYTLALDRQNDRLSGYCDNRHEAVLRLIRMTVENGKKHGIWTGVCGELAAFPELTEWFMELGVAELSMAPSSVLAIRAKLAELD